MREAEAHVVQGLFDEARRLSDEIFRTPAAGGSTSSTTTTTAVTPPQSTATSSHDTHNNIAQEPPVAATTANTTQVSTSSSSSAAPPTGNSAPAASDHDSSSAADDGIFAFGFFSYTYEPVPWKEGLPPLSIVLEYVDWSTHQFATYVSDNILYLTSESQIVM